jgi:hypothetical protein
VLFRVHKILVTDCEWASRMIMWVLSGSNPAWDRLFWLRYSVVSSVPPGKGSIKKDTITYKRYRDQITVVFVNRLRFFMVFWIPPGNYFYSGSVSKSPRTEDISKKYFVINYVLNVLPVIPTDWNYIIHIPKQTQYQILIRNFDPTSESFEKEITASRSLHLHVKNHLQVWTKILRRPN